MNQNPSPLTPNNSPLSCLYDTLPQSRVSLLVGRDKELQTLHQLLQENDSVAIAGIAGVGKTELALQYAKAHLNHYTGGICWFYSRSDLGLQIVEFARSHFPNFTLPDNLTPATQTKYCWEYWASLLSSEGENREILVIIDNVTDYSQIQPYLPPTSSPFKLLITTRVKLEASISILPLEILNPSDAVELLAFYIGKYRVKNTRGKPFTTNSKRKQNQQKLAASPTPPYEAIAQQLCEWLAYLPLGIELVGGYLQQEPKLSLEKMRSRLQKSLTHVDNPITENSSPHESVAAAFELCWQQLDEETQDLGCLLSLFALAPIPWTQVESVQGQLYLPGALFEKLLDASQADSEAEVKSLVQDLLENWKQSRNQLESFYLLQPIAKETYQLQPLIWELFREKLADLESSKTIKSAFCQVMVAVGKQIPSSPTPDFITTILPAIPHLEQTATTLREFLSDENQLDLCEGLTWFYQSQGFYDQAAPWCEQSLTLSQSTIGSNHPDIAPKLNQLAWIYYAQGRYWEAEPLSSQALTICEQHLGSEHPLTVTTRKNLQALSSVLNRREQGS
jgi:tetratricopeptide (TPR) repeat protein